MSAAVETPVAVEEVPPVPVEQQVEEPAPAVVPAAEPTPAVEEVVQDEPKVEEVAPKSTFISKILNSFKSDKKAKVPKSPKKDKKEEVQTPAVQEASTEAAVTEAPAEVTEPAPEVTEPKDAEAAATTVATPVPEAVKDEPAAPVKTELRAIKVGRRLSARVGDLFKAKPKSEVAPPPKVDENPPKLETPDIVAPLEHPAPEAEIKPAEVAAPVIAATA